MFYLHHSVNWKYKISVIMVLQFVLNYKNVTFPYTVYHFVNFIHSSFVDLYRIEKGVIYLVVLECGDGPVPPNTAEQIRKKKANYHRTLFNTNK